MQMSQESLNSSKKETILKVKVSFLMLNLFLLRLGSHKELPDCSHLLAQNFKKLQIVWRMQVRI
jgi:hypothetical protein